MGMAGLTCGACFIRVEIEKVAWIVAVMAVGVIISGGM
jgi:hypothetical protein